MPLETGEFIADLVISNPPGSDPKSQGDDHLRLLKKTVQQSFPNMDAESTVTPDELNKIYTTDGGEINGNVGIGGVASAPLTVHGANIIQEIISSSGNAYLKFVTTADTSGNGVQLQSTGADFYISNNNAAGSIHLATNNISRLRIDGIGNSTFNGNISQGQDLHHFFGNSNELDIYKDLENSFFNVTAGGLFVRNQANSELIFIQTRDSGGADRNGIQIGGDDPTVKLYESGNLSAETIVSGMQFGGGLNVTHDSTDGILTNTVNSGGITMTTNDSGGTPRLGITTGGATQEVKLYHNGITALSTTTNGVNFGTLISKPTTINLILPDDDTALDVGDLFRTGNNVNVKI